MEAPERIWIDKVYGRHPADWDFTDGKHLTRKQLREKVEYIRADLLDAAVNEALEQAAEAVFSVRCAPVSREVAEWAEERADAIRTMKKGQQK